MLMVPDDISIFAPPAKCPKLNPSDNIGQFMRDNYDDIVDHCCAPWNQFADQPWRIMSIGRRKWARGSRSIQPGMTTERFGITRPR
jgi:hypothetical protein